MLALLPKEASPVRKQKKREVDKEIDYPRARLDRNILTICIEVSL